MAKHELEFIEGSSRKFWRIELAGKAHTVTFGRIGSEGTSQTKSFASTAEAKKSHDKLLAQKLAKGYLDTAMLSTASGIPFAAFASKDKHASGIYTRAKTFMGLRVVKYRSGMKPADPKRTVYFFGTEYDMEGFYADTNTLDEPEKLSDFSDDLKEFLASPEALKARGVVLGYHEKDDKRHAVKRLVAKAARLPDLRGIFLGDITTDEQELSRQEQSDLSPLLKAFPKLQVLRARGDIPALSKPAHSELRALTLETVGMDAGVVRSVIAGKFPNLEHLELWLGAEDRGGNSTLNDLKPLFSGKKFPKLRYLGLRNCDYVDKIAAAIVKAPLLERLEILDLSMGLLTDVGGKALLYAPQGGSLKQLNLRYNYLTMPMIKHLRALKLEVDTSDRQDDDDLDGELYRYVAVGE